MCHKIVLKVVLIPTTHLHITHWKWRRELWCFPLQMWLFTTQMHYLHRASRKRSPQECFILWWLLLVCFAWIGFRARRQPEKRWGVLYCDLRHCQIPSPQWLHWTSWNFLRETRENKPGLVLFIQMPIVWLLAHCSTYRRQMRQRSLRKRPISSMCLPSWQFLASSIWKWWRGEQNYKFLVRSVASSQLVILPHWYLLDICHVPETNWAAVAGWWCERPA